MRTVILLATALAVAAVPVPTASAHLCGFDLETCGGCADGGHVHFQPPKLDCISTGVDPLIARSWIA